MTRCVSCVDCSSCSYLQLTFLAYSQISDFSWIFAAGTGVALYVDQFIHKHV